MGEKYGFSLTQQVGKTANLVIFLGILGIVLSIAALTMSDSLAGRGYGTFYAFTGLLMVGFGYGVRYRYKHCLNAALILFVTISCHFLYRFVVYHTAYILLRFQALSPMKILIETNTFPDKTNRFIGFLSRQKKHDHSG